MKVGTLGRIDIFAKIILDDLRHVGVNHLVVGDACARRVGQRHAAGPVGLASSRARPASNRRETLRVEEVVVDAAVNHIDPFEAVRGAHVNEIVDHHQVAAFDQIDAHLLGQERMLEIGRIENART